jgi:NADH-quinone oxidoreductase subunit J
MSHQMLLAGPAAETTRIIAYWVLAIVSVAAALGMILARRAVHCALMLAVVMLSLAVMYAMLGAPFLAFVQVIVYTGAVLMLFLFVLMIVGITAADSIIETLRGQRLWAAIGGIALLVLLALVVGNATIGSAAPNSAQFANGNVTDLAHLIFTKYVFPFELTSALLITAALGAMVLAHRERTSPKPTQRDLARQRIASGRPTPLPGPGTYAQHNAADMPALLPDGSQSRLSVSPVLSPAQASEESPQPTLPRGESGGRPPGQQLPSGAPANVGQHSAGQHSAGQHSAGQNGTGQNGQEAGDQW